MTSVPDDQSYIVLSGKSDALGHVGSIRRVDSVYWLIPQSAILRRLLTSGDVQDGTRLGWVRQPNRRACLESFACPLRIDVFARCIILQRSGIARSCGLDISDQLPRDGAIQSFPFYEGRPASVSRSLYGCQRRSGIVARKVCERICSWC